MKVSLTRFSVIFLLFLLPLGFMGCADDQQGVQEAVNAEEGQQGEYDDQGDDSEYSADEEGGQEGGEAEYDGGEETAEGSEDGGNYADEYGGEDTATAGGEEGGDNYADASDVLANDDVVDNALANTIAEDPAAMDGAANGGDVMAPEGAGDGNMVADGATQDVVEAPQTVDGSMATTGEVVATPAALPELGSKMAYIVKKGDTLGDIAGRIYGDRSKWREMAELSSLINPNLIYIGDVVYYQLTQETVNFAQTYEGLPRQEVVVQAGDTLSTIASRVLNGSEDWKHLWRQNDTVNDPDALTAGTVLYYIAPGALSAALESNKVQEYKVVEDVNVEVEDVKIEVELDAQVSNKIAGSISKVTYI